MPSDWLYIAQVGSDGPIKIGRTGAVDPIARIAQLQTASPWEVRLIFAVRRGYIEPHLHARFAAYRMRGEWFDAAILDEVLEVLGCTLEKRIAVAADIEGALHG